ncbi:MAG: hypothetical protein ACK5MG_03620 [Bacteroidales bacterium]
MKTYNKASIFSAILAVLVMANLSLSAQSKTEKLSDTDKEKIKEIRNSHGEKISKLRVESEQLQAKLQVVLLDDGNKKTEAKSLSNELVDLRFEIQDAGMAMMKEINEKVPNAKGAMFAHFRERRGDEARGMRSEGKSRMQRPEQGGERMRPDGDGAGMGAPKEGERPEAPEGMPQEDNEELAKVKEIREKYRDKIGDIRKEQFSEAKMKEMMEERKATAKKVSDLRIDEYYEILSAMPNDKKDAYKLRASKRLTIGGIDAPKRMGMNNRKFDGRNDAK